MKNLFLLVIFIAISTTSNAQKLEMTSIKRIDPSTIIASNYINTPNCTISNSKLFDSNNPYTYLQLLLDENGIVYQLLYQTNFIDELEHLSISNNANHQCLTIKKNEYCSCVKKLQVETFPSLQTSGTLDCVVQILKRCD